MREEEEIFRKQQERANTKLNVMKGRLRRSKADLETLTKAYDLETKELRRSIAYLESSIEQKEKTIIPDTKGKTTCVKCGKLFKDIVKHNLTCEVVVSEASRIRDELAKQKEIEATLKREAIEKYKKALAELGEGDE